MTTDLLIKWWIDDELCCGDICPDSDTCATIAEFEFRRGPKYNFSVMVYHTIRDLMLAGY